MGLVLIGEENSKRSRYFEKACGQFELPLQQICWQDINKCLNTNILLGKTIKIDPPENKMVNLENMQKVLGKYREQLQLLSAIQGRFLNHPQALLSLLDKKNSKLLLQDFGISVTKMFWERVNTAEQLFALMREKRCYSVFVKPRFFSGAAGVAAVRMHPVRGEILVYTSCRLTEQGLVNTKKLWFLRDKKEIIDLLDALLSIDCVTERWHPKAKRDGKSFDLRVVYQFDHIAYMVVRESYGPITNLHLNNRALPVSSLNLDKKIIREIEKLCKSAMELFPGLRMAGIDIMLDSTSLRPRIIEMNGQGDLIYQDIFDENSIYREQVQILKNYNFDL